MVSFPPIYNIGAFFVFAKDDAANASTDPLYPFANITEFLEFNFLAISIEVSSLSKPAILSFI